MKKLYDREAIRKSIGRYVKIGEDPFYFKLSDLPHGKETSEAGVDKFIELYEKATQSTISHDAFIESVEAYKKLFGVSNDTFSFAVANKLADDERLFSKIRFTIDGSYLNNRIVLLTDENTAYFHLEVDGVNNFPYKYLSRYYDDSTPYNACQMIDKMYENFDVIFCQFPIGNQSKIANDVFERILMKHMDDILI